MITKTYHITGMHCAACESIIKQKLDDLPEVSQAAVSLSQKTATIDFQNQPVSLKKLNAIFQEFHYQFSETAPASPTPWLSSLLIAVAIIIIFWLVNRFDFSRFLDVTENSSLPTFFFLGLIAGVSTCAALVGGLLLSLSKKWSELYPETAEKFKQFQPHILFNIGRLASYFFFGLLLGLLGAKLQLSANLATLIIIFVSIIMILLGLQMLGVKLPFAIKSPFAKNHNHKSWSGKYFPIIIGALTFFLPCGFTLTAQGAALLAGQPWQSGLILFSFALGTTIPLLLIGGTSQTLLTNHHLAKKFTLIAGMLILIFGIYNINQQFKVQGWTLFPHSFTDSNQTTVKPTDNVQVIRMTASASGYSPENFTVKKGVPVRWEITDIGTSGCTNSLVAKSFFKETLRLVPGKTTIKEFTPTKTGRFPFSCWMGMITGEITVIN